MGLVVKFNNISFHFRLIPRKTNYKTFQKTKKKSILEPLWALMLKLGQKRVFLEKMALSVFPYSNYLPSCQKSEKTKEPFLRKKHRPDRQIDFIGPSVGRSNNEA